jgi:hypothetical protein
MRENPASAELFKVRRFNPSIRATIEAFRTLKRLQSGALRRLNRGNTPSVLLLSVQWC